MTKASFRIGVVTGAWVTAALLVFGSDVTPLVFASVYTIVAVGSLLPKIKGAIA